MPTYDYRCNACEHAFEQFQSITAPVMRTCPKCGKKKLERLIGTGAGFIFKGGGFYETDYRSDSYKKSADAEQKSSKGGDEAPAKKEESKSAAASDTAKPPSTAPAADAPKRAAESEVKKTGSRSSSSTPSSKKRRRN